MSPVAAVAAVCSLLLTRQQLVKRCLKGTYEQISLRASSGNEDKTSVDMLRGRTGWWVLSLSRNVLPV
jgi:hypothetical protein